MWGAGAALRCAAEGLRCAARAEAVGAPLHLSPIVLVHEPPTADVCQWLVSCECLTLRTLRTLRKSDLGLGRADDSSTRVLEYSTRVLVIIDIVFFNRYRKKKGITIIHYINEKIHDVQWKM
jgi:hypothetical protein